MTTHDLDALGLLCPLPVLKLRKFLKGVAPGDVVRLRADDPAAIVDVPHFCAEASHTFVEMIDEDSAQIYVIRKNG